VIQNSWTADLSATSLRIALMPTVVMPFFSAAATNCAASMASPTMCRAILSSQSAARDGEAPVHSNAQASRIDPKILDFCIASSSCG
jgi:hypothetical protein